MTVAVTIHPSIHCCIHLDNGDSPWCSTICHGPWSTTATTQSSSSSWQWWHAQSGQWFFTQTHCGWWHGLCWRTDWTGTTTSLVGTTTTTTTTLWHCFHHIRIFLAKSIVLSFQYKSDTSNTEILSCLVGHVGHVFVIVSSWIPKHEWLVELLSTIHIVSDGSILYSWLCSIQSTWTQGYRRWACLLDEYGQY